MKQTRPKALVLTLSIEDGNNKTEYKPGGVIMIIHDSYASMVVDKGSNKQGQWVWATVEGKSKIKMMLITF